MIKEFLLKFSIKYISWVILVLLTGFIYFDKRSSLGEIKNLWDTIGSLRFKLEQTKDFASKLSVKLDDAEEIEKQLSKKLSFASDSLNLQWSMKLEVLRRTIKAKNEKLRGNVLVEMHWVAKADSLENAIQEKIGERYKVSFERKFNTIFISGHTLTKPPFVYLSIQREPIGLSVIVTEAKSKLHNVYVTSSDPDLIFSKVDSRFIGFDTKYGFWDKVKNSPRLKLGFLDNDIFIRGGLRMWKLEAEAKIGNKGFAKGISFNLLN